MKGGDSAKRKKKKIKKNSFEAEVLQAGTSSRSFFALACIFNQRKCCSPKVKCWDINFLKFSISY